MRHCMRCERRVYACSAFVLARDTLAADRGEIHWTQVRELCGWCSEELQLKNELHSWLASIEI